MMGEMKPQFSISTLLLLMAFIAISLGGSLAYQSIWHGISWPYTAKYLLGDSPYLVPLIFAAFMCGRKSITLASMVAFALIELSAIGVSYWIYPN